MEDSFEKINKVRHYDKKGFIKDLQILEVNARNNFSTWIIYSRSQKLKSKSVQKIS